MDNKMAKATELHRSDGKKMLEYSAGMGQLEWSIVLEQAKENILDGRKYKKLIKDGITSKNFIRCHFKRYDDKYNFREDIRILEYDYNRVSNFVIIFLATIENTLDNKNYDCFLYMPLNCDKKVVLITVPAVDKTPEKLPDNITDAILSILKEAKIDVERETLNMMAKLYLDTAFKKAPDEYPEDIQKDISKWSLWSNPIFYHQEYVLAYTEQAQRIQKINRIRQQVLNNLDGKTDADSGDLPLIKTDDATRHLYSELLDLISITSAEKMTVLLGYYLNALFYCQAESAYGNFDFSFLPDKNKFAINIVSRDSDKIKLILNKLNYIFFDCKLVVCENISDCKGNVCPVNIISISKDLQKEVKNHFNDGYDVPIIFTSKSEQSGKRILNLQIRKVSELPLARGKKYSATRGMLEHFKKAVYDKAEVYSKAMSANTKNSYQLEDYLKAGIKTYYNEKKEIICACEDKNMSQIFFFVENFIRYCVDCKQLSISEANNILDKLFKPYFETLTPVLKDTTAEGTNITNTNEASSLLLNMLGEIYKNKFDAFEASGGNPKIHKNLCLFENKENEFLADMLGFIRQNSPEREQDIHNLESFIKCYNGKAAAELKKIWKEQGITRTSSSDTRGARTYSYNGKTYVAIKEEYLKA